jgi:hypothetical protein
MFLERIPVLERYDLDRIATQFASNLAKAIDRPKVSTGLVTPTNDRLTDIFL